MRSIFLTHIHSDTKPLLDDITKYAPTLPDEPMRFMGNAIYVTKATVLIELCVKLPLYLLESSKSVKSAFVWRTKMQKKKKFTNTDDMKGFP